MDILVSQAKNVFNWNVQRIAIVVLYKCVTMEVASVSNMQHVKIALLFTQISAPNETRSKRNGHVSIRFEVKVISIRKFETRQCFISFRRNETNSHFDSFRFVSNFVETKRNISKLHKNFLKN